MHDASLIKCGIFVSCAEFIFGFQLFKDNLAVIFERRSALTRDLVEASMQFQVTSCAQVYLVYIYNSSSSRTTTTGNE